MKVATSLPVERRPHRPLVKRLLGLFPPGQFARYLCVGAFNTMFGYASFALALASLNELLPQRRLYLTVVLASLISTPLSITTAYLGYKLFVFRTHGNYLREWLKAFAVYGTAMVPGLALLSGLTRVLQRLLRDHPAAQHAALRAVEGHLRGPRFALAQRLSTGDATAGYLAGALVMGFTTVYSFVGHKKVTFKEPRGDDRV